MNRRKLLRFALAAVPALASPHRAYAADPELVVGCDTSFQPFEFKQGESYVGFDIDLWSEIAKSLDRRWRLQTMDFTGLIPALQTRNIDVALACITIREDRRQVIDFSDPYYESGLSALVRFNNQSIHGPAELAGMTIGAKTGTATIDYLKKNVNNVNIRQFPNIDNAFLELQTGRVDAVVHNTPNLAFYANTAGRGLVRLIEPPLQSGQFAGIAFPKGSSLLSPVNIELKKIKGDGRYKNIYSKWLGKEPNVIP